VVAVASFSQRPDLDALEQIARAGVEEHRGRVRLTLSLPLRIENSGHMIQFEAPDAVANAVRDVVTDVRGRI
jgi:pimeloyl-ACP methyl ester carboxylesterase